MAKERTRYNNKIAKGKLQKETLRCERSSDRWPIRSQTENRWQLRTREQPMVENKRYLKRNKKKVPIECERRVEEQRREYKTT